MLEYGFEEGKDFSTFLFKEGSRPSREYSITIDSAMKYLCIQKKTKASKNLFYCVRKIAKKEQGNVASRATLVKLVNF
jgi:phage anti-repressor protein